MPELGSHYVLTPVSIMDLAQSKPELLTSNLWLHRQQTRHCVYHTLLEWSKRYTQDLAGSRVVKAIHTIRRVVSRSESLAGWEPILELRKLLTDNLCDLFVGEMARHREETFTASFRLFDREDMRQCQVTYVDIKIVACWGASILCSAGDEISNALVGGIEGGKGGEIVCNWA
jgi:hypothetical protein